MYGDHMRKLKSLWYALLVNLLTGIDLEKMDLKRKLDNHIGLTIEAFSKLKEDQVKDQKNIGEQFDSIKQCLEGLGKQFNEFNKPIKPTDRLTPHIRKAFSIIIKLLNESNKEWLSISNLITELYPNKDVNKARMSISNIITTLIEKDLLERKREANYVYIKLTDKGYEIVKTELTKLQIGNLSKFYDKESV